MGHGLRNSFCQPVFICKGTPKDGLLRILLDQFFQKRKYFGATTGTVQMTQEIFQLRRCLRLLIQADIQLNQIFANGNIVRFEGAELFEDPQSLAPVQMLHVNISHALEQFDTPKPVRSPCWARRNAVV